MDSDISATLVQAGHALVLAFRGTEPLKNSNVGTPHPLPHHHTLKISAACACCWSCMTCHLICPCNLLIGVLQWAVDLNTEPPPPGEVWPYGAPVVLPSSHMHSMSAHFVAAALFVHSPMMCDATLLSAIEQNHWTAALHAHLQNLGMGPLKGCSPCAGVYHMGFRVALGLGPNLAGDPDCEMRRVGSLWLENIAVKGTSAMHMHMQVAPSLLRIREKAHENICYAVQVLAVGRDRCLSAHARPRAA